MNKYTEKEKEVIKKYIDQQVGSLRLMVMMMGDPNIASTAIKNTGLGDKFKNREEEKDFNLHSIRQFEFCIHVLEEGKARL